MFFYLERDTEKERESMGLCRRDRYVERKVAIRTDNAQILSFRNIFTRKGT